MNIPNTLTLLRIALIPVMLALFYLPYPWARASAAAVFALAALTDLLDGWLARRLNQTSAFGAFLDPVADKLMVSSALVLLVQADPRAALAVAAAIFVGREIGVAALREFMAQLGVRSRVAVATVGKVKTVAQMVAIGMLLYGEHPGASPVYDWGYWLLMVAAVLTLWSMGVYLKAAWPYIRPGAPRQEKVDAQN
jgi:CDP-diacylglycerol--glycerol-3-phosphate 3-phosphatidyltransferase